MTRLNDIDYAIELGVDALGFVFYPGSSRYVSIEQACELTKRIPAFVNVVAVLVNADKEFIHSLINEVPVQLLQFHGEESPDYCNQFNKPFIKAIHPRSTQSILDSEIQYNKACAMLMDTASQSARGGTGLSFDWQIIPPKLNKPYILAGGLNENNIKEAVTQCNPFAVDVCSGVEGSPGIKDHQKMSRFVKAIWG